LNKHQTVFETDHENKLAFLPSNRTAGGATKQDLIVFSKS